MKSNQKTVSALCSTLLCSVLLLWATSCGPSNDAGKQVERFLAEKTEKPFNGVVLIAREGKVIYQKTMGYSDMAARKPLLPEDGFVIGSLSKQFTAVMVLQELDRGTLKLDTAIRTYLPDLPYSWANKITIHQLLTHTHGIDEQDPAKPLKFNPGSQFDYSQYGFHLLSLILEKVTGKSFADLSASLFRKCGMANTFYPGEDEEMHRVKGYAEIEGKKRSLTEKEIFEMSLVNDPYFLGKKGEGFGKEWIPAGGFISNAQDLLIWNRLLHEGKLLKKQTYAQMISKQKNAVRQHPIFGPTHYGYGITVDQQGDLLQLGQTGRLPGFASMNFYYPETQTTLIVLSNMPYYTEEPNRTFYYHTGILRLVRQHLSGSTPK